MIFLASQGVKKT